MAGSVNKVILVGNVGKDPEVRSFDNGGKVCNFSLATSESYRDKQSGERRDITQWHNIAVFNDGLIGVIDRYVSKGSRLYIEGQLQTRKWQDRDGNDRFTTEVVLARYKGEIVLLDNRQNGSERTERDVERDMQDRYPEAKRMDHGSNQSFDLDDEIPF